MDYDYTSAWDLEEHIETLRNQERYLKRKEKLKELAFDDWMDEALKEMEEEDV